MPTYNLQTLCTLARASSWYEAPHELSLAMPKGRQTCTECSMRRQKCDRQQPCGRCIRRGHADRCSIEWGPDGYDPKKHRVYPRPEGKTSQDGQPSASNSAVTSPHDVVFQVPGLTPGSATSHTTPSQHNILSPTYNLSNGPVQQAPQPGTIDFPGPFGQIQLGDYDSRLKSVQILDDGYLRNGLRGLGDEDLVSTSVGGTETAQIAFMQLLLPSRRQIHQLVEYQIDQVSWYHVCFHGPTLLDELNAATTKGGVLQVRDTDLKWMALLFSVMAASMFSVSESQALSWGFQSDEKQKLTRQWFKCCVTSLNLADYMRCHHIHSVQAITILSMTAHVLGYSTTQSTLLGAAYKIAQGLGLQRLGLEDDEMSLTTRTGMLMVPAQRQKIVQRETGRRVWAQLCIQDWFSIAFSEMYSVNPLHFATLKPSNVDDTSLQVYPDEVPGQPGFINFLYDIARLMPTIHDAILGSNTLFTKYERVLEADSRLRQLVTEGCPKYLNVLEPLDPSWPPWIPWARRSVQLCYHHKTIMIHRPFLARSFTEPTFNFSRRACLSASKNILKEAKQAFDEEGPALWIDQAFMVAAGITLVLDLFHRRRGEPELMEHKKLVESTINTLSKYDSMIGARGCRMLASLLAEQSKLCASNQLGMTNKRAVEDNDLDGANGKRQKFDVPRFVERFVGDKSSFTDSLGTSQPAMQSGGAGAVAQNSRSTLANGDGKPAEESAFSYETFEQLFPPQAGISNSFLFEDLLNFDI
jgi:hypothetical protein